MKLKRLWKIIKHPRKVTKVKERIQPVLTPHYIVTPEQRFHASYTKIDSGCWEWQNKRDRYGYGIFKLGGKSLKAHRYSFQTHNEFFDKKLHVLHRCDNPCCVNPEHLFLGTNLDNIRDKMQKNRTRTKYKKLTDEEKRVIVDLLKTTSVADVAKQFSVNIRTVSKLYQNSDSAKTA